MNLEAAAYKKDWQKAQRTRLDSECDTNSFVYVHLRESDGQPFYVGIGFKERRPWELYSRGQFHKNVVLKHGIRIEIVADQLTWEAAKFWEVRWIKALRTSGYNLVNGTDGGDDQPMRHSDVKNRHLKNVSRGESHYTKDINRLHPMKMAHVKASHLAATSSDEFKAKQRNRIETEGNPIDRAGAREKHLAYCNLPEVKEARSKRMLGDKNPMSNQAYRDKISKVSKGRKQPHIVKPVMELSERRVFESIVEAGNYYGIVASSIGQVCLGKRKTAGKRKFKYVGES